MKSLQISGLNILPSLMKYSAGVRIKEPLNYFYLLFMNKMHIQYTYIHITHLLFILLKWSIFVLVAYFYCFFIFIKLLHFAFEA